MGGSYGKKYIVERRSRNMNKPKGASGNRTDGYISTSSKTHFEKSRRGKYQDRRDLGRGCVFRDPPSPYLSTIHR